MNIPAELQAEIDQMDTVSISPRDLAFVLSETKGSVFMRTIECFDMLERNEKGSLKRMKVKDSGKNPNPWTGKRLVKVCKSQVTANFNYEKKRESRGGDEPATRGSWHMVYLNNGKITPLSVHKADCIVENPDDSIFDQRAVVIDGTTQLKDATTARLYLRYEIVRESGPEGRQDREMKRSASYWSGDQMVDGAEVEPYLPAVAPRTDETDMQLTCFENLVMVSVNGTNYLISH